MDKQYAINVNFNKNASYMKDFEEIHDTVMETFHILVGNQLLNATNNTLIKPIGNANMPQSAGKTLFVCANTIPFIVSDLKKNKNYFKDNSIVDVKILSNQDYADKMRKEANIDNMGEMYLENNIVRLDKWIEQKEKSIPNKDKLARLSDGSFITIEEATRRGLEKIGEE